jgi:hypothetical protein
LSFNYNFALFYLTFQKNNIMKTIQTLLKELNACDPAQRWAENKSVEEIIETCNEGDWLLWLASRMYLPVKQLILAAARCAKTVMHLMKDQRSIDFVNLAERFALSDDISEDDFGKSYCAAGRAFAAAYDTANYYAASAAYSACASRATFVSEQAARAAFRAAQDDPRAAMIENKMQTANICREVFGKELIEAVNAILNK